MIEERTEEEKLLKSPIVVTLGGVNYPVTLLPIRYSSEWRIKFKPILLFILRLLQVMKSDNKEEINNLTVEMLTNKMPEIIDCFFSYARELNREEIESIATDGDVLMAFLEVVKKIYVPFVKLPLETPGKAVR